tara:strand:- start:33518 stop:34696 length:1179 start_codon:yes stop_codon:yes gene_type:complete
VNLLFNAESLRPPVTGVGHYSLHLLEQFLRSDEVESVHCFTGTHWQNGEQQLAATAAHLGDQAGAGSAAKPLVQTLREAIGAIPGTKALYDKLMDRRFERYANAVPDAIYHETNYLLKPYAGPCVTTVHDLSHMRYPQFHPEHVVKRLNTMLPRTLARADHVITVSDVVRDELLQAFPLPPEKVTTIYEGVDARYVPRTREEVAPVLDEYGLAYQQYVLLVATLEPRKGIDVLLAAWEMLPLELRKQYPLVLTGSSGWRNAPLLAQIEALKAEGSVRHLGYVPSTRLPSLFSGATVFAYPSVYEGFGLPVLDAMSSGVPVICRAGTSMAEFAQGACLLCDSSEPAELAEKLRGLLDDKEARTKWGERGLQRAAAFSWERCARETQAVYRALR